MEDFIDAKQNREIGEYESFHVNYNNSNNNYKSTSIMVSFTIKLWI